ncbi:MAG TPA: hypothetical protein VD713_07170 [Sphingomonadales bacterium]|nr:hypothetical protein [Sphingomonadales bacterium]
MAARLRWNERKKRAFLKALAASGVVAVAARAVGLAASGAYQARAQDKIFAREWDAALEEALDALEAELRRRAMTGTRKPVFYRGKKCGSVRTYSDRLGMFLLKRRRPHLFSEEGNGRSPARPELSPREILQKKLDDMGGEASEDS